MKEIYHCSFFQFFGLILKYFYYESRAAVGAGLKKVPCYAHLHKNVTKVMSRLRLEKGLLELKNVTVGPLFCKFGNWKSYQIRDPNKNRDLSPCSWQNTGPILCIQDFQYKRWINLDQNSRQYQLDIKKMSRIISNCECPWKCLISTLIQAEVFSVLTIVSDNRKNRQNRKLTKNSLISESFI